MLTLTVPTFCPVDEIEVSDEELCLSVQDMYTTQQQLDPVLTATTQLSDLFNLVNDHGIHPVLTDMISEVDAMCLFNKPFVECTVDEALEGIMSAIGNGIKKAWQALVEFLKRVWKFITGLFSRSNKMAEETVKTAVKTEQISKSNEKKIESAQQAVDKGTATPKEQEIVKEEVEIDAIVRNLESNSINARNDTRLTFRKWGHASKALMFEMHSCDSIIDADIIIDNVIQQLHNIVTIHGNVIDYVTSSAILDGSTTADVVTVNVEQKLEIGLRKKSLKPSAVEFTRGQFLNGKISLDTVQACDLGEISYSEPIEKTSAHKFGYTTTGRFLKATGTLKMSNEALNNMITLWQKEIPKKQAAVGAFLETSEKLDPQLKRAISTELIRFSGITNRAITMLTSISTGITKEISLLRACMSVLNSAIQPL